MRCAEGTIITELAGRPPLQALEEIASDLPVQDQVLMSRGLHIGLAIDEYKTELGRGDFLIRAATGADQATGAMCANTPFVGQSLPSRSVRAWAV